MTTCKALCDRVEELERQIEQLKKIDYIYDCLFDQLEEIESLIEAALEGEARTNNLLRLYTISQRVIAMQEGNLKSLKQLFELKTSYELVCYDLMI